MESEITEITTKHMIRDGCTIMMLLLVM